jgi:tripartite-type tricarboxylate transporter receptor subunit TctC
MTSLRYHLRLSMDEADNRSRSMSKLTLPMVTAIAVGLHAFGSADAQVYPSRPITLVVPVAPGGGTDTVARVVAEKMSKLLGQPVVVENRPGGNGTIATRQVARSTPDGHTLGLGMSAALATAPTFMSNIGYDPRTDFSPVGLIAASPLIVSVHPPLPAQSLKELIALARKEPGRLNYASGGAGSPTHLAPELFASMTGIKINHIPYKGTGPAITDLLGGHVSMAFTSLPPAVGVIRDGRVRALAVTSTTRSRIFPNVPTIAESGLPGYEAAPRYGIIAPARTPRVIIDKLNMALREALASEEVKARLIVDGAEVLASTPEEYAADIDREETKWSKIVRQVGIKLE